MNCPICNSKTLLSVKHGTESVYCPECNEVWSTKRIYKSSIYKSVLSSHTNNGGYISDSHIYNKTNDHKFIDDSKRKKELYHFFD
jgi:Zn-finger nucleic acid-binding protein